MNSYYFKKLKNRKSSKISNRSYTIRFRVTNLQSLSNNLMICNSQKILTRMSLSQLKDFTQQFYGGNMDGGWKLADFYPSFQLTSLPYLFWYVAFVSGSRLACSISSFCTWYIILCSLTASVSSWKSSNSMNVFRDNINVLKQSRQFYLTSKIQEASSQENNHLLLW